MGDVSGINWLAIPHEQLYKEIRSGRGVATARSAEAFYRKLRKEYEDARFDLAEGLKALGAAWDGLAADSAKANIGRYGPWAELAGSSASSGMTATVAQSDYYTRARDTMPEPRRVTAMPDNGVIQGLANFFGITTDRQLQEKAAHEAHLRAVEVMRSYAQNSKQTATGFPAFAPPPQVGIDVPGAPVPAPRPPIGGAPPIRGPRGGQIGGGDAGSQQQGGGVADQQLDPALNDAGRRGTVEQQGFQPTLTDPVVQPIVRDGGGYTGSGGGGGLTGGIAGFSGGVGGSGGVGAGGGSARGGQQGGGVGQGGRTATPSPAAAQAGRNVTGKPGQSFMQPALGSPQREEDTEHTRKYSVTDDLVGELPKVAPPVIGE
ncbi:PPE domain-containing protein [Allokutzneria albata]|uniref:PPE family protein n=1 Tax=Allokutzneria albata TaxID=211114 RepID=A0A1H0A851_ALLAB|nr:PPE domain-containing protein [Allokutzneria albata]SDN29577.1 PPE family protein [Allokutzneria albata]